MILPTSFLRDGSIGRMVMLVKKKYAALLKAQKKERQARKLEERLKQQKAREEQGASGQLDSDAFKFKSLSASFSCFFLFLSSLFLWLAIWISLSWSSFSFGSFLSSFFSSSDSDW